MKKKLLSTTVLLLFIAGMVYAQKDIKIDYKAFSQLLDISKSQVRQVKAADQIYFSAARNRYKVALPLYLEVYDESLGYDPLDWRIAMCYLHSENKPQALSYILRCDTSVSKLYDFYLGKAYHFAGQFDKAKENYRRFATQLLETDQKMFFATFDVKPKDYDFAKVMQDLLDACDVGISQYNDSVRIIFENIKVINTKNDEFYPMLFPDGQLIYTSNKSTIPKVEKSNFQIFSAACDSVLIVGFPRLSDIYPLDDTDNMIALPYNTYSEGLLYQSMNSKGGDVMMTYQKGKNLSGKAIPKINSSSKEGLACFISKDTLVFSSDRDNALGQSDLYMAFRDTVDKWGKPVLIGGTINTEAHEEVVCFYKDELYYISNGKGGMGGYDIYKVPYLGHNNWGEVQNLGYPINTADNDMSYFPVDDYNGFYSGVRPGGLGGLDIYKVTYDVSNVVDVWSDTTVTVDSVVLDLFADSLSLFLDSLSSFSDTLMMDSTFYMLEDDTLILDDIVDTSSFVLEDDTFMVEEPNDTTLVDAIIEDVNDMVDEEDLLNDE